MNQFIPPGQGMGLMAGGTALAPYSTSLAERLDQEIEALNFQLKRKERLRILLDENPVIKEALELLGN